jgi:Uma2 family endonuclease
MQVDIDPPFLLVKPGVTEDEFYSAGEDCGWEYLDGRLVMLPASDRHQDLFSFLMALLRTFLDERGGAVVRGSRYPMRLDERWSPEPDLLVVREARRHLLGPQRLEGPADLVIEIASDGSGRLSSLVLPGFWIEASWLWQDPLPSTLACLRQILG